MGKRTILLYNPSAEAQYFPLALLAVASLIDRSRYRVEIVDAGIEPDATERVEAHLDDAVCLGVTVITGTPIADALRISEFAKQRRPDLPVVWGGWHPSIFPDQCLANPNVDIVSNGQSEETFAEIVERVAEGRDMDGCRGTFFSRNGDILRNPPRRFADVNDFPAPDFSLIDVPRYIQRRGAPMLDYSSSQGCPYRCTFCAEPLISQRRWSGIEGPRLVAELLALQKQYGFEEVHFKDEIFFVNPKRVRSFCQALIESGAKLRWRATARADEVVKADEEYMELIKRSGGCHIFVGAESGSEVMLKRMKKDIVAKNIWQAAEKMHRWGIEGTFTFIVGFPHEPPESAYETIETAKRLRQMDPGFDTPVFFFTPYPGTEEYQLLVDEDADLPHTLEDWGRRAFKTSPGNWISENLQRDVKNVNFYLPMAYPFPGTKTDPVTRVFGGLARWRLEKDFYGVQVERPLKRWYKKLNPTYTAPRM